MNSTGQFRLSHRAVGALLLFLLVVTLISFAQVGAAQVSSQPLPTVTPCDKSLGNCWVPAIGTKWQWQISCDTPGTCTKLAVKVPFYDIDWNDTPAPEPVTLLFKSTTLRYLGTQILQLGEAGPAPFEVLDLNQQNRNFFIPAIGGHN